MNPNQDKLKGTVNGVVGKAKEAVGKVMEDKKLKVEGQDQQLKGEAQKTTGAVKSLLRQGAERASELLDDASQKMKKAAK